MRSYIRCRMRPTKSTQAVARSSAIVAAAFLVHSFAQAGGVFKAAPCEMPGMRQAVLQHVNQVRARGFDCGGEAFGPAQPVAWNDQLVSAAAGHSEDMAEHNYFAHENLRGVRAPQRVDAVGYKWRSVGENIAAGAFTARTVMSGWMDSPSHCRNIMNPKYTEIGVACIAKPGTTYGEYWTMVLARR